MNQESPEQKFQPQNRRSSTLIKGTIVAVLVAGIGWQFFRPDSVSAEPQEPGTATVASTNQVLARVNGQNITYDVVAQECMDRYGREVLENVINRVLIQQACTSKRVRVTEEEVLQEITRISKRFGLDASTWYKMLQAERGLTPLQYQRDVIWPMLALKKLAGREVKITTDMLRQAYVDAYGPKARCKMIMLDNHRRAQEVWEECRRHPADFERLAQEHSVEPNSRSLGGTVPPIRKHTGAAEPVRKAAFNMRTPGEISPIIHVGVNSYVILKFDGFTEKVEHDPKDVRAQLEDELMEQERQRLVAETFQQIRDSARIQNKVTGESTTNVNPVSSANPGRPVKQTGYAQPATQPRRQR